MILTVSLSGCKKNEIEDECKTCTYKIEYISTNTSYKANDSTSYQCENTKGDTYHEYGTYQIPAYWNQDSIITITGTKQYIKSCKK